MANYIKGQACTQYNDTLLKLTRSTPEYHKVDFCLQHYSTLTLLTFYSLNDIQITTYADDITITASHTKHQKAQQLIKTYLYKFCKWATTNNLHINIKKTITTLITPDPDEYGTTLSLKLNNKTLPTSTKHPKIFPITLDSKLTLSKHIKITITKAKQMFNFLKALTSTKWSKQRELIVSTFKAITWLILEYANTIWSPIVLNTNTKKLQTIQNTA